MIDIVIGIVDWKNSHYWLVDNESSHKAYLPGICRSSNTNAILSHLVEERYHLDLNLVQNWR